MSSVSCGVVPAASYWHGSHVARMQVLVERLR